MIPADQQRFADAAIASKARVASFIASVSQDYLAIVTKAPDSVFADVRDFFPG
jgi:hypothetical protein